MGDSVGCPAGGLDIGCQGHVLGSGLRSRKTISPYMSVSCYYGTPLNFNYETSFKNASFRSFLSFFFWITRRHSDIEEPRAP